MRVTSGSNAFLCAAIRARVSAIFDASSESRALACLASLCMSSLGEQLRGVVAAPTPAEQAVTRLREAALTGEVGAQLALADAYEQGRAVPKDLVAAYVWADAASGSERADPEQRRLATTRLAALSAKLRPEDMQRARLFARRVVDRCNPPAMPDAAVVVLGVEAVDADPPGCQ